MCWLTRMPSPRSADRTDKTKGQIFTLLCGHALTFTIASFAGWLYEVVLNLLVYGIYADRGILHLPLCPIYGFGSLALLLLFHRRNAWYHVFLASTVLVTVLELVCSYLLEAWLGFQLWNYADWPLQFEGRISLLSSVIFGVMSLLLVKALHPLVMRLTERAPALLIRILGLSCAGTIAVDFVLTVIERSE